MEHIATSLTASISELKANPMGLIAQAGGEPLAILNRNKPAFYCLSPEAFEAIMDYIDDMELVKLAQERLAENAQSIEIDINDL